MAGRIDQIQLEFRPVPVVVRKVYRLAFDGYAPLPLNVHGVEDLIPELAIIHQVGILDKPVGKG
ncbi:MAG: hypothetical protein A4E63_01937 [Syntrophorhabdus sp. PtaU1.Bin050]|nr:MAG: hypothetical protein A4E63_01937 [Syntrophorhabdus sp. PtaU1.Bin050]